MRPGTLRDILPCTGRSAARFSPATPWVTWPYLDLGWAGLDLNRRQNLRTLLQLDDLNPDMIAVGHGEPAIGEQVAQLRTMIRTARAD